MVQSLPHNVYKHFFRRRWPTTLRHSDLAPDAALRFVRTPTLQNVLCSIFDLQKSGTPKRQSCAPTNPSQPGSKDRVDFVAKIGAGRDRLLLVGNVGNTWSSNGFCTRFLVPFFLQNRCRLLNIFIEPCLSILWNIMIFIVSMSCLVRFEFVS